ncbi:Ca2+-binding protein, RTX toxin-related [Actinoplanes philippinensis]|uniref:Ca2+-binding protein, RTX toxin-related n=3 Tax=Actinoplanes philippinensis TaxID=35752 RepID=A0A1I2IXR1_9ACTN|nr:peroxidase family protein [Actinoplanes philippinensis]SFF47205.1 Ca2+-binding protein, RTX toxin-related [Actinoplanes philippinensis]
MRRVWSAAALGALLATTVMVVPAQAAPIGQGFTITEADLSYILQQIKIAEAHVAGTTSETGPCGALLDQLGSPLLSMGLRTVDGTCNHLTPGQESHGAADREFPRLVPAQYTGVYQGARPVDATPRQISNIIADQTAANPAAVAVSGGNTDGVTLFIPNVTTDFGLSAPYNSWFTLFGQFFDHGVDQTVKGNDIVMVPLRADDPLVAGPDRLTGTADDPRPGDPKYVPPAMRFMMLTRAKNPSKNTDTPYVDNSQTYTSHAAHQVFLREYAPNAEATGNLLSGAAGGLPTWADVKRQAREALGLELGDLDALNVPMILADAYGNFVPGPARGLPQYVTATGLVEGDLVNPVKVPANVVYFDTPFLTDIAHNATPSKTLVPDADTVASADFAAQPAGTYDDEMLAAHYIAGDGRANENIGLTAVHQIFHSEHNRLVSDITRIIGGNTEWTGERIFQAAKFINEMEYQHLVFEEFARKIQPAINPFQPAAFTQAELDPAIYAEFAHAVYRFGHSMLDETIQRPNAGNLSLLDGFLNPPAFTNGGTLSPEAAAGEIVMGMTEQVGNDLDEFMTDTLRNNLLGLPMDLGAINIARGRSEGVPTLNNLRRALYTRSNDGRLRPYVSWVDFGENLKHPESLVNFVAAYGKHPSVAGATTVDAKRAAARALLETPAGADFLNATGAWTTANSGLDDIDLWIGGLAETTEPFGGLLGSTFDYVFESQLTALQNGDRLYYLARTPGMNLRSQLEGNTFAELISRNTTAGGLRADVFATADCKFDMATLNGTAEGYGRQGNLVDDDPASECDERALLLRLPDGTIAYRARNSVDKAGMNAQSVYTGTENRDRIRAGNDNDTIWGAEGDDVLEGGAGDDVTVGGEGDDILTDSGGADFSMGGPGNDAIDAGPGLDIILGGDGRDFTNGGANANETFGGEGDDMIIAGDGEDSALGDSGDDWMEGGDSPDLLSGDSGNLFFRDDSNKPGHDVLIGQGGDDDYDMEGGDDIGVQGPGIEKNAGGSGWDWSIAGAETVDSDLQLPLLGLDGLQTGVRDRYDEVESLSGGNGNDILRGDDTVPATDGAIGCDALDATGIARIHGLDQVVTELPMPASGVVNRTGRPCDLTGNVWGEGNILLGGAGDDLIEGRLGNDIIDGDRYLTVRLAVRGTSITASSLTELRADVFAGKINPNDIIVVREIASAPTPGRDTAVFAGARAEYAVTPISGGVLVSGPDGNDIVRNVELLHFDDQTVDISGMSAFLGVSAFAGDGRATVLITVPDATGADPVTALTLERTGAGETVVTTLDPNTRSLVVTGLTNGAGYTFRLRADTAAGPGVFTAPFGPVTPAAAVPGDDGPAEPGDGGPAEPGENEEPAPNPVPTTTPPVVTPTTPPVVTPTTPPVVTPTTPPVVTPTTPPVVTPTTAPPVTPPRPVTPVAPDAPGIGAATAGDESALVRWTTPLHDGGTPIYGYEIQALDAETGIVVGVDVADAGTTELTLTGLTNGVGYAFWVRAVNAAGASAFSGISNTVTPAVPAGPGTGNPGTGPGTGNPGTDPGTGNPGTDPGTGNPGTGPGTGNPGTGNPGSTVPATPTPTVSVTPTGSPAPTGSVTPRPTGSPTATPSPTGSTSPTPGDPGSTPDARTVPGAARIGTPAPAAAAVVVRWTAPADNGGSPIQRYEIQVLTGNGRQVGDLRTAPAGAAVQTVNGLADGTLYRFRVRAVNALGAGSWSATSTTVTPRTVPGKVRTLTAKPGAKGGKLTTTVRWTAPATTGGSKITGYRITWQRLNAKGTARGTALVTTVAAGARTASFTAPGDVPANTRYRVTVQAVNGAGAAPGSAVTTTIR